MLKCDVLRLQCQAQALSNIVLDMSRASHCNRNTSHLNTAVSGNSKVENRLE